jgi:hypothetical protein
MIPARHHPVYVWFFDLYSRKMLRRYFRKVDFYGGVSQSGLPVLMVGNHFSWWDGFIACYINQRVFEKKLHIMMLEEQLRPRMFLNKAGAFSIKPGVSSMITSLEYASDLLSSEKNLVVLYPQGKFSSVCQFPIRFQKGISFVARRVKGSFRLVIYAALVDYFESRKPTLSIYLREIPMETARSLQDFEDAYNDFLLECMKNQAPQ